MKTALLSFLLICMIHPKSDSKRAFIYRYEQNSDKTFYLMFDQNYKNAYLLSKTDELISKHKMIILHTDENTMILSPTCAIEAACGDSIGSVDSLECRPCNPFMNTKFIRTNKGNTFVKIENGKRSKFKYHYWKDFEFSFENINDSDIDRAILEDPVHMDLDSVR